MLTGIPHVWRLETVSSPTTGCWAPPTCRLVPPRTSRALRRRGLLLPTGFRQTADRGRGCGRGCSETHHASGTGSGRWTSPSSRPPAAGSGGFAQSATTPPSTASPPPSPRRLAAWMRSVASAGPVVEAERVLDLDDLRVDRGS
jgi:hypothetical protein